MKDQSFKELIKREKESLKSEQLELTELGNYLTKIRIKYEKILFINKSID